MKKTYISPALELMQAEVQQMLAASITNVGGDSGIELGTGDTPVEADVKGEDWDIWSE